MLFFLTPENTISCRGIGHSGRVTALGGGRLFIARKGGESLEALLTPAAVVMLFISVYDYRLLNMTEKPPFYEALSDIELVRKKLTDRN